MSNCLCCGHPMVQCFRHHETVSFCRHCWQEMPDLGTMNSYSLFKRQLLERTIQQPVAQHLALAS